MDALTMCASGAMAMVQPRGMPVLLAMQVTGAGGPLASIKARAIMAGSSVGSAASRMPPTAGVEELLVGPGSLGGLLQRYGCPAVPSDLDPMPKTFHEDAAYACGRFSCRVHGKPFASRRGRRNVGHTHPVHDIVTSASLLGLGEAGKTDAVEIGLPPEVWGRTAAELQKGSSDAAVTAVVASRDQLAAKAEEAFGMFDEDGSGAVDHDELGRVLVQLGMPADQVATARAIAAMDVDGDGEIDLEEFTKWYVAEAETGGGGGGEPALVKMDYM